MAAFVRSTFELTGDNGHDGQMHVDGQFISVPSFPFLPPPGCELFRPCQGRRWGKHSKLCKLHRDWPGVFIPSGVNVCPPPGDTVQETWKVRPGD